MSITVILPNWAIVFIGGLVVVNTGICLYRAINLQRIVNYNSERRKARKERVNQ